MPEPDWRALSAQLSAQLNLESWDLENPEHVRELTDRFLLVLLVCQDSLPWPIGLVAERLHKARQRLRDRTVDSEGEAVHSD